MKRVLVIIAILGLLGTGLSLGEPPPPSPTPTPNPTASPLVISITGAITVIRKPTPGPGPLALVPIARSFGPHHAIPDHAIYVAFDPDAFFVTNRNTQGFLCIQDQGVCVTKTGRIGEVTFDVTRSRPHNPPPEDLSLAASLPDLIGDQPDGDVIAMNGTTPGNLAARVWLPAGTLTAVCDSQVHWWDIAPVGGTAKAVALTHTIDLNTKHALTTGSTVTLMIDERDALVFDATGRGQARIKIASVEPSSSLYPPREDHHFLLHYLAFVPVPANGKIECREPMSGQGKGQCPFPTRKMVGCQNPVPLPASDSATAMSSSRGSNCPPAVW